MKSNFVYAFLLISLSMFACQPSDKVGMEDNELDGYSEIEVSPILMGKGESVSDRVEFNTIEFETPYVFTSEEEFFEKMVASKEEKALTFLEKNLLKNDSLFRDVDFSEHSVVAMTGLASSFIRDISSKMYMKGDDIFFDVFVDVADSCRAARKWNLLLKVPFAMSGSEKVSCRVSTNQPIKPVEPDYTPLAAYPETPFGEIHPVGHYKFFSLEGIAPYFVIYKQENHDEIMRLVYEHPTALLYYNNAANKLYGDISDGMHFAGDLFDHQCMELLYYCEYGNFIEPNKHLFEKVYHTYQFISGSGAENCGLVPTPVFSVSAYGDSSKVYTPEVMTPLINYLGGKAYKGNSNDEGQFGINYTFDESKIHYIDFVSIISRHYGRKGSIYGQINSDGGFFTFPSYTYSSGYSWGKPKMP